MSKSNNNMPRRRELYAALALFLPVTAFAAITPAAGGPGVVSGTTPVVNIVAPNGAGVSHNRFEAFGVDASGVVLNNSVNAVQSQLAGQINGNANLTGGAAKVIITEVTGQTARRH
jgi:filamentous hemagglutinin family protein